MIGIITLKSADCCASHDGIYQTIIDGFFNMMMIVDYSNADEEFGTVVDDLDKLGEEIGVRIRCQREEIFTKMHRV